MFTSGGSSSSASTGASAQASTTTAPARPSLRILLVGSVKGQVTKLHETLKKFRTPFDACLCVGEFSAEEMDMDDELDFRELGTPVYFIDSGPATQDLIESGDEEILPGLFFLGHSGVTKILNNRVKIAFLSGTSLLRRGLLHKSAAEKDKHRDAEAYFKSESLFDEGCYTNLCVTRLKEELELEENVDFFLSTEACNSGKLGLKRHTELVNFLISEKMRESTGTIVTSAKTGTQRLIPAEIPSAPDFFVGDTDAKFYREHCCDAKGGVPKQILGPAISKPANEVLREKVVAQGAEKNWADILSLDSIGDLVDKAEPRYFVCSFGNPPESSTPTASSASSFSSWKTRPPWRHQHRLERDEETNNAVGNYGAVRFFALGTNLTDHNNSLHGLTFTESKFVDVEKVSDEFQYKSTPNIFVPGKDSSWEDVENLRRQIAKRKRSEGENDEEYEHSGIFDNMSAEERRRWKKMHGFSGADLEVAHEKLDAKRRKLAEPPAKKDNRKSLYHNQKPIDKKKMYRDR